MPFRKKPPVTIGAVLATGFTAGLLLLFFPAAGLPKDDTGGDSLRAVTEFTYRGGPGDSREMIRALGLFGAKSKAVALAAKYFTHKGLLVPLGKKQSEIFCLAADEITATIMDEKFLENGETYVVRIKATVSDKDFIQAEIMDLGLEKKEDEFSYDEEMEEYLSNSIDPARELSRAFRLIRKGQWRMALIYLNHLSKKYPHWADIYMAKAIGFYGIHAVDQMMEALRTACSLGSEEACSELKSFNTGNGS